MVKGKQFKDFKDTGDPVSAARIYNAQKADELVFIDIEASYQNRSTLLHIIEKVAKECFMPLTVGGGVRSVGEIRDLLRAGADKVVINTAAVETPNLILEASEIFGRQCIVVGVDVRATSSGWDIYTHSGRNHARIPLKNHLSKMEKLGAGEILINSIDRDGMMNGYDFQLLKKVRQETKRPVIAMGGAGNFQHLADVFVHDLAQAVACASLFHFGDNNPIRARAYLKNSGIPVKNI